MGPLCRSDLIVCACGLLVFVVYDKMPFCAMPFWLTNTLFRGAMGSVSMDVSADLGSAGLGETAPSPALRKPPDSLLFAAARTPAPTFASFGLVSGFFVSLYSASLGYMRVRQHNSFK